MEYLSQGMKQKIKIGSAIYLAAAGIALIEGIGINEILTTTVSTAPVVAGGSLVMYAGYKVASFASEKMENMISSLKSGVNNLENKCVDAFEKAKENAMGMADAVSEEYLKSELEGTSKYFEQSESETTADETQMEQPDIELGSGENE